MSISTENQQLKSQISELEKDALSKEKTIDELTNKLREATIIQNKMEEALKEKNSLLDALDQAIQTPTDEYFIKNSEIQTENQLEELKKRNIELESEKKQLLLSNEKYEVENQELKDQLYILMEQCEQLIREKENLESKLQTKSLSTDPVPEKPTVQYSEKDREEKVSHPDLHSGRDSGEELQGAVAPDSGEELQGAVAPSGAVAPDNNSGQAMADRDMTAITEEFIRELKVRIKGKKGTKTYASYIYKNFPEGGLTICGAPRKTADALKSHMFHYHVHVDRSKGRPLPFPCGSEKDQ